MYVARRSAYNGNGSQKIFRESVKLSELPQIISKYRKLLRLNSEDGFGCSASLLAKDDDTGMIYLGHEETVTQVVTILTGSDIIEYFFWNHSIAEVRCNNDRVVCYSQLGPEEVSWYNLQLEALLRELSASQ